VVEHSPGRILKRSEVYTPLRGRKNPEGGLVRDIPSSPPQRELPEGGVPHLRPVFAGGFPKKRFNESDLFVFKREKKGTKAQQRGKPPEKAPLRRGQTTTKWRGEEACRGRREHRAEKPPALENAEKEHGEAKEKERQGCVGKEEGRSVKPVGEGSPHARGTGNGRGEEGGKGAKKATTKRKINQKKLRFTPSRVLKERFFWGHWGPLGGGQPSSKIPRRKATRLWKSFRDKKHTTA